MTKDYFKKYPNTSYTLKKMWDQEHKSKGPKEFVMLFYNAPGVRKVKEKN